MPPRRDPKPPKDGSCFTCGKPRNPERSRRYGGAEAQLDPFCSADCCRVYHGLKDPPEEVK